VSAAALTGLRPGREPYELPEAAPDSETLTLASASSEPRRPATAAHGIKG